MHSIFAIKIVHKRSEKSISFFANLSSWLDIEWRHYKKNQTLHTQMLCYISCSYPTPGHKYGVEVPSCSMHKAIMYSERMSELIRPFSGKNPTLLRFVKSVKRPHAKNGLCVCTVQLLVITYLSLSQRLPEEYVGWMVVPEEVSGHIVCMCEIRLFPFSMCV